jgi:hypothetical protein
METPSVTVCDPDWASVKNSNRSAPGLSVNESSVPAVNNRGLLSESTASMLARVNVKSPGSAPGTAVNENVAKSPPSAADNGVVRLNEAAIWPGS